MSPKVDAFIDRHWKAILGILVGGIIAWQTLEAKVRGLDEKKANRSEIQALDYRVDKLDTKIDAVLRMQCQDAKRRDSMCP